MKPEEIQALLDLQELDLKLLEYERHQKQLPGLIEEIERPVRKAQDAKDRLDAELTMARSQHKTVELELASNNQQFKKLQTQQMAVRNQIEYEAFQHEMESLKERQDSLEEAGIKWIERETDANGRLPEFEQALADIRAAGRFCIDLETTSLSPHDAEVVGFALAWAPGKAVYVPVAHVYADAPLQLERDRVRDGLAPLLTDPDFPKLGQNSKYEWQVLGQSLGIRLQGVVCDTMLAAYLLDPGRRQFNLDELSRDLLGHTPLRRVVYEDGHAILAAARARRRVVGLEDLLQQRGV